MARKKFPKTLGECIDMAYAARGVRLAYQREVDERLAEMKALEEEIEQHILQTFDKAQIEGAKGMRASASVSRLVVPQVKDWNAAFDWIEKHHAWDLMEKRMARLAYRDRTEAGEQIPGVEPFVKVALSLTRINGKE